MVDLSYRQSHELIAPDPRLVTDAAAIIHLREFDLFRAAWQNWFGQPPDDEVLERFFVDYLFHQNVPFWVRHFANRVIRDARDGRLDRHVLGIADYPTQEPLLDLGGADSAMTYIAILVLYLFVAAWIIFSS